MNHNSKNFKEFYNIISDMDCNPAVQEMKKYRQHYDSSCYEHCLSVAYYSFCICKKLHLDCKSIELLLNDIIKYSGFDINNKEVLLKISDNIKDLYNEILKVTDNFSVWIYKGNSISSLKNEIEITNRQNNIFNKIKKYISDICNWF